MRQNYKLGIFTSKNWVNLGIVKNQFVSLYELKVKKEGLDLSKLLNDTLNRLKLKSSDIDTIRVFQDDDSTFITKINQEVEKFAQENKIEFIHVKNLGWILDSNWIYSQEEIDSENITDPKPQYPYLTVVSNTDSTDLIINQEKGDSKIVGSVVDITPEKLMSEIQDFLEIDKSDKPVLLEIGDHTIFDFEFEIEPEFDLTIGSLKEGVQIQYEKDRASYNKLEESVRNEMLKNLKADLLAGAYEKLFDYLITKFFGIADAFDIRQISLIGNFWLNKRFQDKIIRMAITEDFKIKFPNPQSPMPAGSFLASYNN